jgi:hypothetical protein
VTDETRARFLAAIAAQLPADRIAEVHLFPAIRQGGMESGVAVVAVELARDDGIDAAAPVTPETDSRPAASAGEPANEDAATVEPLDADAAASPYADEPAPPDADAPSRPAPRRYTVFSARYRHTLKGPDRGKWEASVTEEADAPLVTVDAVVRGVQRRSGDVDEIVRLSGDEVRAAHPTPASR